MTTMDDMSDSSCRLLRLPNDLLRTCLPEPNVRRTVCRSLFNQQLEGDGIHSLRLCLKIMQAEDVAVKRETLVRTAKSFPALSKLRIQISETLQPEILTTLLAPPPIHSPAWLNNIVDVTISAELKKRPSSEDTNLFVDSFIPQCIANACPQLQRLELQNIHIHQQPQWKPVNMSCLKELIVDCLHVAIKMQPAAAQQQVHALSSLQKFKLATFNADFVNCCRGKVTELHGNSWSGKAKDSYQLLHKLTVEGRIRPRVWVGMFELMPKLRHLVLKRFDMNEVFKGDLSQLETITVDSCLNWGMLNSLHNLLANTARPPKLHFGGAGVCLDIVVNKGSEAERDVKLASDFMAIMRRGGGLRRQDGRLVEAVFDVGTDELLNVQQVMHGIFCAVSDPAKVCLSGHPHVDRSLLTAVGELRGCWHLRLVGYCTFEDDVWDSMVSLLPHVSHITFFTEEPMPVPTPGFQAFCRHATHAIKVSVDGPYLVEGHWSDMHVKDLYDAAQGTLVQFHANCLPY